MKDHVLYRPMYELREDIVTGSISIVDLTCKALERARALGQEMNYFTYVGGEEVLRRAETLEREIRSGKPRGPLHGIPITLKDNIEAAGYPITNGAPYTRRDCISDSVIVQKLKDAGAVIIGKNNMHELALGATNINPHYGPSLNPWDKGRITGGSSGGSAGSVAAGIAYGSIGTDTGGSIRIPAALCGIVGLKPTYGLVSLEGVIPLSWSLDHAGPLTRSVKDAAIMLSVLTGRDYYSSVDKPPQRFKVGVLKEFVDEAEEGVKRGFWKAMEKLEEAGGELVEVEVPYKRAIGAARATILLCEAALYHLENLRRYSDKMGRDVSYLLKLGLSLPATAYIKSMKLKETVTMEFKKMLSRVDVIASPTTAVQAPKIEEAKTIRIRPKLLSFTEPHNLTGAPTISLPAPETVQGLPVGVQLTALHGGEEKLLRIARAYELTAKTLNLKPPL